MKSVFKNHCFALIAFCCLGPVIYAQDLSSLSDQGYGHWITASRLSESASSVDDYILIATEYEDVIKTDPSFSEAYIKLVQAYEKIGLEKGASYFSKAEVVLDKYAKLKPGDNRTIQSERSYLQALREKYNNGPNRFDGKWGYKTNNVPGNWFVQIKWDGSAYQISFKNTPESIDNINATTWNVVFVDSKDCRSELRSKGWTKYVDDCSSSADPGFPTSGTYYYDSWRTENYYKITLEGNVPHVRVYKQHCYHYLSGSLTYSETLTNEWYFSNEDLVRKD